jgi:hypothetical protein
MGLSKKLLLPSVILNGVKNLVLNRGKDLSLRSR